MSEWIHCINADILKQDDGTLECIWLGDLSVRRSCEYCYAMLEWKTQMKEEGWSDAKCVAHGEHPDWPGEWVSIWQIVDSAGVVVGYEAQWKLYKTLHEAEADGWKLIFSYFGEGKEIYRKEESADMSTRCCGLPKGCENQCCLNRSGICTLDSADFYDIERAEGMRGCNLISINDRYLLWKYGVTWKDFVCKSCAYYEGEMHGICTNDEVKPHTKSITVNGKKEYIDSKEYYSGAHACKKFKKQEGEIVPKRTYWTKCGREFQKNSTAEVTGYTIDGKDKECADCPFQVEVKEGWPPVHKRWECRAGSKRPNHKNEWTGSLEDKNTIHIMSLDNEFLEAILAFCKEHPDLSAGYNQDRADCRRTLSISCSPNKKGIAAKRALVEKFFPNGKAVPEICRQCENIGTGCVPNDAETEMCIAYVKKGGEEKNMSRSKEFENNKLFEHHGLTCATCTFFPPKGEHCNRKGNEARLAKPHLNICDWYHNTSTGEMGPAEFNYQYKDGYSNCPYKDFPSEEVRRIYYTNPDIKRPEINDGTLQPKHMSDTSKSVTESTDIVDAEPRDVASFDYSTVDQETAAFLQEKANRITEIRIKSVIALGKELKEAQDRLANHDKTKGTFQKWVESIGITPKTAYNYINGFDYVVKNFHNIEDAEHLQPSLLFAVSKSSAPKQLQEAVLSGDITTHKQYKELEQRLKAAEERAERAIKAKFDSDSKLIAAEQEKRKAEKLRDDSLRAYERDLNYLHQQLEQAKRNSDPSKVRELGQRIAEYQQEIQNYQQQIGNLNRQLAEKDKQLKEKPIEVPATRVVEKETIPDEVRVAIYDKVAGLYEGLLKLTETEIKIFAEDVCPDYYDEVTQGICQAIRVLESLDNAVTEAHEAQDQACPSGELNIDPTGCCAACKYADMDKVTEAQLDDDKTWCTLEDKVVSFDHNCGRFERVG